MKQVFINIPVNDVEKSMQFYLALGFTMNPLFTDEQQKCMVWSDAIYIMLQTRQFANTHLSKQVTDARKFQMPSFTLPVESEEVVDETVEKGLQANGTEPNAAFRAPFMYLRTIEDIDGYTWGVMCLDLATFKAIKDKL